MKRPSYLLDIGLLAVFLITLPACVRAGFWDGTTDHDGATDHASAEVRVLTPATGLGWVETSPVFQTTVVHATWTLSTGPNLKSERVELHRDSTTCQNSAASWVSVTTHGTYAFTVEVEHLYSYRVESRDTSGQVVMSVCSPVLDVRDFSWKTLGPRYWPELRGRLQAVINQGVTAPVTIRQFPSVIVLPGSHEGFQGTIFAQDGFIYGIPRYALQLARLTFPATGDPVAALVGPTFAAVDKWYGATLARDGKVYTSPSDSPHILRFDASDIAHAGPVTTVDLGGGASHENKWMGLRLAPNGLLIACPRRDEQVLVIDPRSAATLSIRRVGPKLGTGEKWLGGVLAPNGKIYCIPGSDHRILEIDPDDLTVSGIKRVGPDWGTGTMKWWGGALASNGQIYAAPSSETRVLEIVPTSIGNSRRVGPDWGSQHEKWAWSTLAPNGKLYAVACNRDQVLEIDPADLTATGIRLVGPVLSHTDIHKYFAASVASNGKLYAFPWYGTSKILEIDTHARGHFDRDLLLNGHLNGQ